MVTIVEVNKRVDTLTTAVNAERDKIIELVKTFRDEITSLMEQVQKGRLVTQSDLDKLAARVSALTVKVKGISTPMD